MSRPMPGAAGKTFNTSNTQHTTGMLWLGSRPIRAHSREK